MSACRNAVRCTSGSSAAAAAAAAAAVATSSDFISSGYTPR
jgi:hypothetical protein